MSWIVLLLSGAFEAALTVGWAMLTGTEPFSLITLLLILGLVACVVGLKLVSTAH